MFEQIKKGILTGIGMGLVTNEKIMEFAKKSAEEANMSTEEARKLAEELIGQSDEAKQKLEEKVDERIRKQLDRMGLATKEDVEGLKKEILKLQKGNKKSTRQKKAVK
jgi:polyhydroxyalkanoate synthesis regulator phasin